MPSELSQRIDDVTEDAEMLFWAHVASRFPEAKSGDFPIDLTIHMRQKCREWVKEWVRLNTNLLPFVPDSSEWFGAITNHLNDLGAELENTGGGILCIGIPVKGYYLLFGTANECWGADIYVKEYCGDLVGNLKTGAPSCNEDTLECANAIRAAVQNFVHGVGLGIGEAIR